MTPEYVTPQTPDGGLANYLRKTALALRERGHDVAVIVASDRSSEWSDAGILVSEVPRLGGAGRRLMQRVPFLRRFDAIVAQYVACRRIARRFWRLHEKKPFDLVQASSFQAPGYVLLNNGKVPLVCRASSYTPLVRSAYGRRRTFADHLSDWFEISQVTGADAAFAPSELIANAFERLEDIRPAVIRSVAEAPPSALDDSFFSQHRPPTRYLLSFGTLSRIKGIDVLADVMEPILSGHADLGFVLIGRDDGLPDGQSCIDYIRSRTRGVGSRVHYYPSMSKAELMPFIANAVAVVMPSRVDNYPNACLEAQSLGIPVIGTRDSSLEEMIVDGETGFLARNADPADLQRVLEQFLEMTGDAVACMKQRILAHGASSQSADRIGGLLEFYSAAVDRYRSNAVANRA